MSNVVVLFGKPGAGKGTRLSELQQERKDDFEVISVGNLLRSERKNKTHLGRKAEHYMNSGRLVPDELINEMVIPAIKASTRTVITDGYPRTVDQAKAMIDAGECPKLLVFFDIDDEVVVERAKQRIVCSHCSEPYTTGEFKHPKVEGICDKCGGKLVRRSDDEEATVRERLEVFMNETLPVVSTLMKAGVEVVTIDSNIEGHAPKMFAEVMKRF